MCQAVPYMPSYLFYPSDHMVIPSEIEPRPNMIGLIKKRFPGYLPQIFLDDDDRMFIVISDIPYIDYRIPDIRLVFIKRIVSTSDNNQYPLPINRRSRHYFLPILATFRLIHLKIEIVSFCINQ